MLNTQPTLRQNGLGPCLARPLLATFVFLAAAASAPAETYFVRPSGDDSKDGKSLAHAFRTVTKANSVAASGDRIYIGAGTYDESITTGVAAIMYIGDPTGQFTGSAGEVKMTSATGPVISHLGGGTCEVRSIHIERTGGGSALVLNHSAGELRLTFVRISGSFATGIDKTAGLVRMFDCDLSGFSDMGVRSAAGSLSFQRTRIVGSSPSSTDDNLGIGVRHGGSSTATLNCCIIENCHLAARQDGGTFNFNNCILTGNRDGFLAGSATTNVRNTTIAGNTRYGLRKNGAGTIQVVSSIIASSGTAACRIQSGSISGNVVVLHDNPTVSDQGSPNFTNHICGNPKFVNPAARNFRLQAGSAAINPAVTPQYCPGDDFLGIVRSFYGTNDAGAFEYTGVPPQPTPYTCDFEQSSNPGWTRQGRISVPGGQSMVSGQFGKPASGPNDTQTLFIQTAPGETYRLTFDLFKFGTWSDNQTVGVRIDGRMVWTYALVGSTSSTPVMPQTPTWTSGSDQAWRASIDFVPTDSVTTVTFDSTVGSGMSVQSWGIDDVNIKEPTGIKIVKWREIGSNVVQ